MIKARAGTAIIFGLSEQNVQLLKQGRPIHINLQEIGIANGTITIFYGPTEEIIETQLFTMLLPKKDNKEYE